MRFTENGSPKLNKAPLGLHKGHVVKQMAGKGKMKPMGYKNRSNQTELALNQYKFNGNKLNIMTVNSKMRKTEQNSPSKNNVRTEESVSQNSSQKNLDLEVVNSVCNHDHENSLSCKSFESQDIETTPARSTVNFAYGQNQKD